MPVAQAFGPVKQVIETERRDLQGDTRKFEVVASAIGGDGG